MKRIVIICICVMAAVGALMAKGHKATWQEGADARKSDYIFMEAQRYKASDQNDAYYALMKAAYELASEETSLGFDLGFYEFVLSGNDQKMAERGYRMMESHFAADPADYYGSLLFGDASDRMGNREKSLEVWRKLYELFPEKTDAAIRLADALESRTLDSAKQREAIDILNRVSNAEGLSLALTSRKASAYMNLGDTMAVKAEILRFIEETPESPESRVFAGDVYMAIGQPDSALTLYTDASRVDPASGLAYYKLAEYYKSVGDSVSYDREVFNALSLPDVDLDTKLNILTEYVRTLYDDPLQQPRINDLFATLIDLYPHEPDVHNLYSSYLVAIDEPEAAAQQQEYVIDANPSDPNVWKRTIALYFSAGNYEKAFETAKRAIEAFPQDVNLYITAGEAAVLIKKYDDAQAMYDAASKSDRLDILQRSQLLTSQGDLQSKLGSLDRAIELYDSALTVNPLNAMTMNNYAYFLACDNRDLEKAESLSKRSLEISPDNTSSLDTYAWIQFKFRNYAIAKEYIDRTIELTDGDLSAELLDHAGDIYFMNELKDEAVDFWKRALEIEPDNKDIAYKVTHKSLKSK
ncbi:MAG: tetratricopeptide repeat protein [Bacteroidales bacterium]|nr:tetratricopeptide repeat protein [Bacteroidales bacterium]